jgi:Flp pilus assembly protein TadG
VSLSSRPTLAAQLQVRAIYSERGMVTVLFGAIVLPLIFIMLTVTVEFAHFFGLRDEMQSVLDGAAHDALARGLSEAEVSEAVRSRMSNVSGMAELTAVRLFRGATRSAVEARAAYRGAFFQFIQALTGHNTVDLPIALRSEVRIQTAASLILVDRGVQFGVDPCNDQGLQAIARFVDRLSSDWSGSAGARVGVGVIPGATELAAGVVQPVELLASDGADALPRCRAFDPSNGFDLAAIRGNTGMPVGAFDLAYRVQELVSNELLEQASEVRNLVLVLRKERYDQGYAITIRNLIEEAARNVPFSIDLYVLVLDASNAIDNRPLAAGINGGVYREVGVSQSEFSAPRLLGVMSRTLTDRIVLER